MSTLDRRFNKLAKDQRPKYPPPFSLRFTFDERAKLDMLRGSMPLGRYIREQLLGDDAAPRKKRGRYPVKDQEALGRVLGALGSSRLSQNLNQLARASNSGSLPVSPDVEEELRQACADVKAMREELLRALGGLSDGGEP
ncbi:hypothetical protein SAMN05421762_2129 [Pseudooceanicola nitratireducens]|uniref:Mobilisation protein (MobC) n=1 Tax=Pseudooceanicola nitratireducens TaxID=517719 RepID=A0A1I1LW76_9RHOB|nr:hypothetical protein [Pseudooceanicola nitratireducens]SEJ66218.1 hypothetical protein SAMN05216183_104334 [Pseudooceanicola nitratireducens]SFC76742.1 hypothetical protein SAMN05421762_2129 [Pseudooceanicola nitratireducens]